MTISKINKQIIHKKNKPAYRPPEIVDYASTIKILPKTNNKHLQGINFGLIDLTPKPEIVIIVASGSSLKGFNLNSLYGKGYIITLNDTGKLMPNANAWITIDPWGLDGPQLPDYNFTGTIYAGVPENYNTVTCRIVATKNQAIDSRVIFLRRLIRTNNPSQDRNHSYYYRLSEDPCCVATGNSGYAAFNLAYLLKPKKILMLGVDGGNGYFFTNQKTNRSLNGLNELFTSSLAQITKAGIQVINGSIDSNVTCFPRYDIPTALDLI